MTKYYAVKKGKNPGIYTTWDQCKQEVQGYSGALYKSFKSLDEAKAYLDPSEEPLRDLEAPGPEDLDSTTMVAYVDGSYRQEDHSYSFGCFLYWQGGEREWSRRFKDDGAADLRNVAGEILGAQEAMTFAKKMGMKKLILHYDYAGIRHWALGEWKRNKEETKSYHNFYQDMKKDLEVHFIKVEAHSGNPGNERVDLLAKEADFSPED